MNASLEYATWPLHSRTHPNPLEWQMDVWQMSIQHRKLNQPIIGYALCIICLMTMVACIEVEEDPISPQVAQCREREPVPQIL